MYQSQTLVLLLFKAVFITLQRESHQLDQSVAATPINHKP